MNKFVTASIGSKFLMGITGLFLVTFIAVHLTVNFMLILDDSGELFNEAAHFMRTNPVIKVIEPLLGLGFFIHIMWSFLIEYRNWRARPVTYNKKISTVTSSWASRNMFILGGLILVFLVIHIINFFWQIRFYPESLDSLYVGGTEMDDTYSLVSGLFKQSIVYDLLYILGASLLGLHLSHGFWSAFHTLGLTGKKWISNLEKLGKAYAFIVAVGFSSIPLYFLFKF